MLSHQNGTTILLVLAGLLGISISRVLNLEWWQSGILTAGLMVGTDLVRFISTGQLPPRVPSPTTLLRGLLPVTVYFISLTWLLIKPPSITNIAIGILIASVPTLWVIWEMEMRSFEDSA